MYQRILLAVDGSATSDLALREACRIAAAGATIRVVSAVENPLVSFPLVYGVAYDIGMVANAVLEGGRQILATAQAELEHRVGSGVTVEAQLLDLSQLGGSIAEAIQHQADAWPADLVVIGSHGRSGVRRLLLGSVAEQVLRLSRCPVLLVRAQETGAAASAETSSSAA